MLEARDIRATYGGAPVLHGVTVEVREGEMVAMLGPNGAGKTTTLRCLSGQLRPSGGEVVFDERTVRHARADRLARMGVGHVPENRGIFRNLTVSENLRLGGYLRGRRWRGMLDRVHATFPVLADRERQRAGTLSGGQQQMLAIGRALMADPKLLLVDEASLGLAPVVVRDLYRVFEDLNRAGMTLVVVEQSASFAIRTAHRSYVLQQGRVVYEGAGEGVDLVSAYLG